MMVRWMCGVTLKSRVTPDELTSDMNVGLMLQVARHNRLRWFGHVKRKSDDDWVKKCQQLMVESKIGTERVWKSWLQCVRRYEEVGTEGR